MASFFPNSMLFLKKEHNTEGCSGLIKEGHNVTENDTNPGFQGLSRPLSALRKVAGNCHCLCHSDLSIEVSSFGWGSRKGLTA